MKIYNIQNIQDRRTPFTAANPRKVLSKSLIDRYGINIETMVGYKGEKTIAPPPKSIKTGVAAYLNRLQVDWNTHISKKEKNQL